MTGFKILKLTLANYNTLKTNGSVVIGNKTYTYDPLTTIYLTDKTSADDIDDTLSQNKFVHILPVASRNSDRAPVFNVADFTDALEAITQGKMVIARYVTSGGDTYLYSMVNGEAMYGNSDYNGYIVFQSIVSSEGFSDRYFVYDKSSSNQIDIYTYWKDPFVLSTTDSGEYPTLTVNDISTLLEQSSKGRPCFVYCATHGYTYLAECVPLLEANNQPATYMDKYIGYILLKDINCSANYDDPKVYTVDAMYKDYSYDSGTDTTTLEVSMQINYKPYQVVLTAHGIFNLYAGEIRSAIDSVFPGATTSDSNYGVVNCKYRPIIVHYHQSNNVRVDLAATGYQKQGTTYYLQTHGYTYNEAGTKVKNVNITYKVVSSMQDSDEATVLTEEADGGTTVTEGGASQATWNADKKANIIVLATTYSDSSTYAVGDVVNYDGKIYMCNTAVSVAESFDSTKWTEFTIVGLMNSLLSQKQNATGNSGLQTTDKSIVGAINEVKGVADGKQSPSDNNLNTTNKTIVGAINEVKARADGSVVAKGYASYSALIADLNAAAATLYRPGQDFIIQTKDVPDICVISVESSSVTYTYTTDAQFIEDTNAAGGCQVGYYKLIQLETEKVPIEEYALLNKVAPAYDNTATYTVGKIIHYGINFYICTTAVSVAESFDSAKWTQITIADAIEAKQDKLVQANMTQGTVAIPIGFDSQGNLVIGSVSGVVSSIGGVSGAITLGTGLSMNGQQLISVAQMDMLNLL